MKGRHFLALAALAIAALVPRCGQVSVRPLHNDEGVNAIKFRGLYVDHHYRYDPAEFHGPTLPYFTLPAAWLAGGGDFNDFTEATFRRVTAAFGAGLVALWALIPELGAAEILWAALLTAISPAMVYYSRDYIHETPLVFFTALAFFAGWRWAKSGRAIWAGAAGAGLGLMAATKETFIFALAAMALAAASAAVWAKLLGARPPRMTAIKKSHVALGLTVAAGVALLFFTSFFTNARGAADAVRTFLPWAARGAGASPHIHPPLFYFERLFWFHPKPGWFWSEGLIGALAFAGFIAALWPRHGGADMTLARLIAFYTLWLTLFYMAIPYKTPWCCLGFLHGMIALAGVGAMAGWRACHAPWAKGVLAAALAAGVAHLAWESARANFGENQGNPVAADPVNPWVYAQTSPDALGLVDIVGSLERMTADQTPAEVMTAESYWPLPWYFRRIRNAGYWEKIPDQPPAPIMIVSSRLDAPFDADKSLVMAGYYQLRPNVFLRLYVNTDLWKRYLLGRNGEGPH